jgi:glyoxylase-like metal-dependent hydrolase (beta-lactamase superfamily II)/rhodanese-related sulfurtransferase
MKRIDVETLREWLEEGRPVTVLDIREDHDYEESAIPGSTHFDVYEALKAGDPHAMDVVKTPEGMPVVAVCNRGNTSVLAAQQLEARGIESLTLEGGMKAWSLAWNTAQISVPAKANLELLQVRRTAKGCLSYIAASQGDAVVIDPSVEPEVYEQLCAERNWRIRCVLESHVHADHLSRARRLAERAKAELILPVNRRTTYPHKSIVDGETIRFGNAHVTALHTPGHTPESTTYLLDGVGIFTGDTIFLNGVGRPDLHNDPEETRAGARQLYGSVQRLLALDPRLLVLPGHTNRSVPFDEVPIAAPLAHVRADNPLLSKSEEAFVEAITASVMPTPPNYESITRFNESGTTPEGDPTDLESGANRCAIS